ncbi:Nif3-like dinuclear metal center hexameric protein [Crenobacter sp. SG2303]|uniref:Nif3-like dinuclear metal center hexameric protein n=1 Tax=Crenobacter oryzisoli TaxID=3056844 RepID=A0ABT7XSF4_9NEIS|nr:Nif3-like dinuclear metal center hexameric protein [Crenobacter sp. SG2303]MDN0076645.1 Nif3-like dinuclear metal center hexameric protein [Crenobacter sp. SG2303]
MQLTELIRLLDGTLEPWRFKDYAPNGLQVEGRAEVRKVLTGTTASQALIDAAIAEGADAILVHHGYFWKNEDARITGIKRVRLKALLEHDISLIAYHLPLDAHPTLGNNATLAEQLGLVAEGQTGDQGLLWYGRCTAPITAQSLVERVDTALTRPPLLLGDPARRIERVFWCTGGAQGFFEQAIAQGADVFITGEVSEQNYHIAEESGVAFIAAGHHATERYGVKALGDWLATETGLAVVHVDLANPV